MARQIPRKTKAEARQDRKAKRVKRNDHQPLVSLIAEQEAQEQPRAKPKTPDTNDYAPLNANQALYDQLINSKTIVFGLGPAGTGKTWWSVMRASRAFMTGEIERIVCTRPTVEAGGGLGYLPGTLEEKFAPHFRPVYDVLEQFLGAGHLKYLVDHGKVVVTPLEYLRGSTFNDAWVIADEMQNATQTQTKLLLTRIGRNCKMVLNGDPEQCDLPRPDLSGLIDARLRLQNNPQVGIVDFQVDDIVRSNICRDVILAYRRPLPQSAESLAPHYISDNETEAQDAGLGRFLQAS